MNGSCGDPAKAKYDPSIKTENHFAVGSGGLLSEGYLLLLKTMLARGDLDSVLVFIESTRSPGSTVIQGIPVHVVPHIEHSRAYLEEGDIIWVRGGWRGWHDFILSLKGKHWLMLYAANTGRERWKFWDVVLDDLGVTRLDTLGRFFYDFYKPISPYLFFYDYRPIEYDVCIGASHIHEKKAQHLVVEAVKWYKDIYGFCPNCILPGRYIGSFGRDLPHYIAQHGLSILMPGMIPRPELNAVFNRSRMTVFLTQGGQGDRGPMESLCAGTPIIIRNPKRHHHSLQHPDVCKIAPSSSPDVVSKLIYEASFVSKKAVEQYFVENCGFESQSYPRFVKLLDCMIGKNPDPEHLKCLL
jgi:hypothetical protein